MGEHGGDGSPYGSEAVQQLWWQPGRKLSQQFCQQLWWQPRRKLWWQPRRKLRQQPNRYLEQRQQHDGSPEAAGKQLWWQQLREQPQQQLRRQQVLREPGWGNETKPGTEFWRKLPRKHE